MRGCDNFCSFCVVAYTRGRERSREPEGILEEARRIAAEGFKRITLLGQNVNSYRSGKWDFARLLAAVANVPGIERVRFTSPPSQDFPLYWRLWPSIQKFANTFTCRSSQETIAFWA